MGLVVFGRGALAAHHARRAARISNVWMPGYVDGPDEMARSLASCDALFHGSAAETFGMAVAEALCARVPVVVPDVGGAGALYDRSCGERYRAGDPGAAAAALLELLARDPTVLRAGCRARAQTIPSLERHFTDLFATYARIASPVTAGVAEVRAVS